MRSISVRLAVALLGIVCLAACDGGGADRPCDPTEGACVWRVESEDELIGGGLARGAVGDLILENEEARFVIQRAIPHIGLVSQFGGGVIDADIRRPAGEGGKDVFGEFGFLVNLAGTIDTESVEIADNGGAGREAGVVTRGGYVLNGYIIPDIMVQTYFNFDLFGILGTELDRIWPLEFEARYRLAPSTRALRVDLTATNTGTESVPFLLAYFNQTGHVNFFVPGERAFDRGTLGLGMGDMVYFESNEPGVSLSYGLAPDGRYPRLLLALLGAQAAFHQDLADFVRHPDSPPNSIPPGQSVTLGGYFVVGKDLDDAIERTGEAAEQAACSPFLGRVEEEGTGTPIQGVDVTALEGLGVVLGPRSVTNARTDGSGLFRLCLAEGRASLIAGQVGRPYFGGGTQPEAVPVRVPGRTDEPVSPDVVLLLPRTARLKVRTTVPPGGTIPSRLLVLGIDPSPFDPRLDGDGFDPLAPGVVIMQDNAEGTFDALVEPGDVDVVVSRGVEYSMFRQPMVLSAGETREIDVRLHRVVDTAGYLSGDFHVHSSPGPDSTLTYRKRVTNMLAEGVEVIVSTDHDYVTDFGPTIREIGAEGSVATIAGQEVTTLATGHFGPFPMSRVPDAPDGGAASWIGLDPVQTADRVHEMSPEAVFQIMHARAMPAPGNISNYFTTIDLIFDENGPRTGPDAVDPADVRLPPTAQWLTPRFTAMEVVTFGNVQGLSDWLNLLNSGWRLTATGNSDTHTQWVEASGYARNLVRVGEGGDSLSPFDAERFVKAVREGRNSVTLGPFVEIEIRNADGSASAGMGDTLDASGGKGILIDVRVQSPAWLVCDRVTIHENGMPIQTLTATPSLVPSATGEPRNEFRGTVPHAPARDAFYVAVVTGSQSLYPLLPYNWEPDDQVTMQKVRSGALAGTVKPFSVTNPVWVDTDGDGRIAPSHVIVEQDCQNYTRVDRTNPYVAVDPMNCPCVLGNKAPGC